MRASTHPGHLVAALASLSALAGCGAAAPPPETSAEKLAAPEPTAAPEAKPEPAEEPHELPAACTTSGASKVCVPPPGFVKRLCANPLPTVALQLFRKDAPWTRGYVTRTVEAWNASGGASSSDKLDLDEEVIVVVHRAVEPGAMVVSGASGGYDVLRWDGSCATLMAEELTLRRPSSPKAAKVSWKSLEDPTQEAMLADAKVGAAVSERRKECKGATMGDVSLKCVKADQKLAKVLVEYVRQGGSMPIPKKLP
jgi:hypothetical protein